MTDWSGQVREATRIVERWIEQVQPHRWLQPRNATWTNKDLLGHLTAWSDLLIDEVEALQQERFETTQAIDVDGWNAVQVARRRNWTCEAIVDDWRRSARRAADVIDHVPVEAWSRAWTVPWADRPVSIRDLLHLWLVHVEQHHARLLGSGLE